MANIIVKKKGFKITMSKMRLLMRMKNKNDTFFITEKMLLSSLMQFLKPISKEKFFLKEKDELKSDN